MNRIIASDDAFVRSFDGSYEFQKLPVKNKSGAVCGAALRIYYYFMHDEKLIPTDLIPLFERIHSPVRTVIFYKSN
jgi:hypothetical protein